MAALNFEGKRIARPVAIGLWWLYICQSGLLDISDNRNRVNEERKRVEEVRRREMRRLNIDVMRRMEGCCKDEVEDAGVNPCTHLCIRLGQNELACLILHLGYFSHPIRDVYCIMKLFLEET